MKSLVLAALLSATLLAPVADAPVASQTSPGAYPRNWTYERRGDEGFNGSVLVSKGDRITAEYSRGSRFTQTDYERERERSGTLLPEFDAFQRSDVWRWASVTKQIVAVLILQEVARGRVDLDAPITRYLPDFSGATGSRITVRQLLRHQSGLPNPDDTSPAKNGVPSFYMRDWRGSRDALTGYCAGKPTGDPGGPWRYNNCDYIVAGARIEAVLGKPWTQVVNERIARPLKLKSLRTNLSPSRHVQGYVAADREPAIDFSAFGASAGLFGTMRDLWAFDRALMTGRLLPQPQLDELWNGQPQLGFVALGQWVFNAPLKGCAAPTRIVERRGEVGGVEVRNFILPDKDIVVIAFTNRADFTFGEVWQGNGFSYDLLSDAACR